MIKWNDEENPIWLLTPAEFEQLPDGTVLDCIDGTTSIKGKDVIDDDVRFGHMAFGIRNPSENLNSELLTKFRLAGPK